MEPQRKIDHGIDPEIRPDLRPIPSGANSRSVSDDLAASEKKGTASAQDSNSINEGEANGGHTFVNNFGGKDQKANKVNAKNLWLKRGGIIGGSGGLIGILLFMMTGFFGGAGVLLNLGETATSKLDTQSSFLSRRMYSVLDSKIGGDMTQGDCSVTKIACRFSRPSNSLLDRLEKNGITAVDANNQPVKRTPGAFPNGKPERYSFVDKSGTTQFVSAREFTSTLRSNPEFRSLFTKAFNARYWSYADSFTRKAFKKFLGTDDRSGDKAKKIDPEKPQESIAQIADDAGKDNKVLKAGNSAEGKKSAATQMLTDGITEEAKNATKKGLKTGDPVLGVALAACLGINAPGTITKLVRLYQIRQEVALATTLVLTTYSMLKAGDMDPKTMSTLGTILTGTTLLANGKTSKSFMDASAIKNIIFGDNSGGDSYKKFIPGAAALKQTREITNFATDPAVKATCDGIYSPAAQVTSAGVTAAIGAATAGAGAVILKGIQGATLAIVGIVGAEKVMELAAPAIEEFVKAIIGAIPPEVIVELLSNKDIANATQEDLGNATGIGLDYTFQLANENTGGGAATLTQMASYNTANDEYLASYAEQDRVGRSPFDISSPYTFLGSIVSGYASTAYQQGNTASTILSSIGYTLRQPLKLLTTNSSAAENKLTEQYSYASDFGVDEKYAVNQAGSVYTIVPTEYQGVSSQDVLASVGDQINQDSGEANDGSAIESRQTTCTSADLLAVEGCAIKNQSEANVSLYITDKRIVDIFDGTNPDSGDSAGNASGGAAAGATFNEADLFKDSTQTACAVGTDEAGSDTGYHGGPQNSFPVRLCSIPGTDEGGKPIRVSSIVSGAVLAMITAMKADLGDSVIKAADSFRTKEGQEHAYRCYTGNRNPGEDCSDIAGKAAAPGTSMHQSGNAIDFQLPSGNRGSSRPGDRYWEWLTANAGKFGYKQYSGESWHWSATGG